MPVIPGQNLLMPNTVHISKERQSMVVSYKIHTILRMNCGRKWWVSPEKPIKFKKRHFGLSGANILILTNELIIIDEF